MATASSPQAHSLRSGSPWCCTFPVFEHVCEGVYPPLQYHTEPSTVWIVGNGVVKPQSCLHVTWRAPSLPGVLHFRFLSEPGIRPISLRSSQACSRPEEGDVESSQQCVAGFRATALEPGRTGFRSCHSQSLIPRPVGRSLCLCEPVCHLCDGNNSSSCLELFEGETHV